MFKLIVKNKMTGEIVKTLETEDKYQIEKEKFAFEIHEEKYTCEIIDTFKRITSIEILRTGDIIKIINQGIGKIESIYEDGSLKINISDRRYYRNIHEDNDIVEATEKEYIKFIKEMIKQLNASSKGKRKEASDFNKSVNGEATKRKGKVSVVDNNITSLVENSISSHHRELLSDAKKLKETKDKLKKELEYYKSKTA